MQYFIISIGLLVVLAFALFVKTMVAFYRGKKRASQKWNSRRVSKLPDHGTTRTLSILPLIEWSPTENGLKRESGISYLIRTDQLNILFDCGLNLKKESPSPLLRNMNNLGVTTDSFDAVVISHNHMDHVGGWQNQKKRTFSIDLEQMPLPGKKAYVPAPMDYPGILCKLTAEPCVIAKGVALTGTIENYLYLMGPVNEQALAINVADKGVVIIVGCGHQTIHRLIKQVEDLYDEPIYGIIGGLHLPYRKMEGNLRLLGQPVSKYMGTGKLPWNPITLTDVQDTISEIAAVDPKVIALSPHDSSPEAIRAFESVFKEAYRPVIVGDAIEI